MQAVLRKNLLFCSSRNILQATVVGSNEAVANDALMKIQTARKSNDATSLRIFSRQGISLNFGTASYYLDMLDWSSAKVSAPFFLQICLMKT